jgi:hypothetical protein
MRTLVLFCLLVVLAHSPATAQVQVQVRLEKPRYVAGEPVVVVIAVRNIGSEAVATGCGGDVRFNVEGTARRIRPNIFGCFSGIGGVVNGCAIDTPLIQPGQTTNFRQVLKDYDLRPGQYRVTISGNAGIRTRSGRQAVAVPGSDFEFTLSLAVVPATERELRTALAPFVNDADATNLEERYRAREALIESAPRFLDSLIARFAAEDKWDSAIDALGRIGSRRSRAYLKALLRNSRETRRPEIVLALARIGHRDDADFLSDVLRDSTMDRTYREYAALGLGQISGDRSVQRLERAFASVTPEIRSAIATGLGNTRSRAAVPVLIQMGWDDSSLDNVCNALATLTHRIWCDGTTVDRSARRTQWLRWWNETRAKTPIFGPDDCPDVRDILPVLVSAGPAQAGHHVDRGEP